MANKQIRRVRNFIAAAMAAAVIQAVLAGAASAAPEIIPTPFDADGYAVTANLEPSDCLVVTSIDLPTMLQKTADLQAKGLIRDDVDAAHVKSHAWTTAAALALKLHPLFIVTIFRQHPDIKTCKFGQAFVDFHGNVVMAYSFTMTRAIYDKQNWSEFNGTDLPNVADDFIIGPVTAQHMNAEAKLPD